MSTRRARRRGAAVLAALAFVCLAAAPVPAQTRQRPAPAAPARPAEPPPEPEVPPPPYEPQLMRLAEIMGALAVLRDLCGHGDGRAWRARMEALLEVEATSKARKEALAGAYNRAFRSYSHTYRGCTPAARMVIERFGTEGANLSREVAKRYSG